MRLGALRSALLAQGPARPPYDPRDRASASPSPEVCRMASRARQARAPLLFLSQDSAALRLDEPATPANRTSMSQLSPRTVDPMTQLAKDHFDNFALHSSATVPPRLSSSEPLHASGEVLHDSPDALDDFINHARRGARRIEVGLAAPTSLLRVLRPERGKTAGQAANQRARAGAARQLAADALNALSIVSMSPDNAASTSEDAVASRRRTMLQNLLADKRRKLLPGDGSL
jgi:hypothetical protein